MGLKNSNMRKDYLDKRYEAAFKLRTTLSSNIVDVKPFIGLLKEYAEYAIEYGDAVLPYINKLQQLFYSKHLLPFMVKSTKDRYKINKLPCGDRRNFLFYVWLAYKHIEDGSFCDEELQKYGSRNSFGNNTSGKDSF